jgi:hypothetical protein
MIDNRVLSIKIICASEECDVGRERESRNID